MVTAIAANDILGTHRKLARGKKAFTDLNLPKKRATLGEVGMVKETVVINDAAKLRRPLSG